MTIALRRTPVLRRMLLAVGLATALALPGCSTATTPTTEAGAGAEPTGSTTVSASAAAHFPVTVDSAYGELTFDSAPQRIVALTSQVADILVSLGVQPVAVAISQQDITDSQPWVDGVLTGALEPGLANPDYSINIEKVLSFQPDLIVGDSWQVADQATFDKLNAIAPTYAGAIMGNTDWDVLTTALGDIVGEPEKAAAAIADVQAMFAASRDQLASLQGKTYQFVRFATTEGFAFGNGSWLEQFGMEPAANQDNSMQGAGVSLENLDQLNADVLVIWAYNDEQGVLEADARFQDLPSVESGVVLWADIKIAYATNGPGPLSLAYVSDVVLPRLVAGVTGNSGTGGADG